MLLFGVECLPLILRFIRENAEVVGCQHEVVATEELLLNHLFGPHPAAEVLLAFEEAIPVGFALFFRTFSTYLGQPGIYLEDLYVSPNQRRKGYGRQLLQAVARLTLERDCARLEWSAQRKNVNAVEFYKRLGAFVKEPWIMFRLSGRPLKQLTLD